VFLVCHPFSPRFNLSLFFITDALFFELFLFKSFDYRCLLLNCLYLLYNRVFNIRVHLLEFCLVEELVAMVKLAHTASATLDTWAIVLFYNA